MKGLPLLKLLLMIALVAWMQVMTVPAHGKDAVAAVEAGKPTASLAAVPETSSVVLIGALGLMLMLRRRRLQA